MPRAKPWTPRVNTTRRIAGRLLRAHRADVLTLAPLEVDKCVDGITRPFLPTELRRQLGRLWISEGSTVVGTEDPERRSPLDDDLDALVTEGVE